MSPRLGAVGFHFLPALVWAIVARACWRVLRDRRPEGPVFRILPLVTGLMALHYFLHGAIELTPNQLGGRVPGLHVGLNITLVLSQIGFTALLFHLIPVLAIREEPPSRRWLVHNYGAAALVGCMALVPLAVPGWSIGSMENWTVLYGFVILALSLREIRRLKRANAWPRHFDVAFNITLVAAVGGLAIAAALGFGVLSTPVFAGIGIRPIPISLLAHTAWGIAAAAPFAAAMFGEMLRALVVAVVMIGAALLVAVGVPRVTTGLDPELTAVADLVVAGIVLFVFIPGRAWLEGGIEWLIFRQRRRSLQELPAFLHRLSPALGAIACCRRALAEFARILGPRGVGILLADERGRAVHGDLALDTVARVWPKTAAAELPARAFGLYGLRDPVLRTALAAANVALVVPIVSPRRRWGHLFVAEGLLSRAVRDERHVEQIEAFAAQLALVLDAAELLARAVAVERSLAHAEKLAAIGETAARIAHDIRNPVTAARSLAAQLAREPGSPFTAEHVVILEELERVEHHVADLLRFARREELRLAAIDLGALVDAAVDGLRPRLEASAIDVELALPSGVRVRADAEKLRQVVINLLENAADALGDGAAVRRLEVVVGTTNGTATLRVTDTGCGVPPDALPHLFEPFFSTKPHGTGLGLAIAKRAVDAHGGRITATSTARAGTTFEIELPLGDRDT